MIIIACQHIFLNHPRTPLLLCSADSDYTTATRDHPELVLVKGFMLEGPTLKTCH